MAVNVPSRHASSFRVKWRIKGYREEMPMTEKNFQHGGRAAGSLPGENGPEAIFGG